MATMSAAPQQVDPHPDTGRPEVAPLGGLLTASRALVEPHTDQILVPGV